MDALMILILIITSLLIVDALALRFGVDSRDPIGDDYARPMAR